LQQGQLHTAAALLSGQPQRQAWPFSWLTAYVMRRLVKNAYWHWAQSSFNQAWADFAAAEQVCGDRRRDWLQSQKSRLVEETIASADQQLSAGQTAEVIAALDSLEQRGVRDWRATRSLKAARSVSAAEEFARHGDWPAAVRCLEEVVRERPELHVFKLRLEALRRSAAEFHELKQQLHQAICGRRLTAVRELAEKLLAISPQDPTAVAALQRLEKSEAEVIVFPAILPSGTPLWPGFWKKEELEALKAELPVAKWEAQYQQNPTSEEGAIIKRENWRIWTEDAPPQCEYIIQSWDTAFEKSNRADYSACTTWGVFKQADDKGNYKTNIIVLDAFKRRMEFPELKQKAFEMYKEWSPDSLIVEKKAAGAPLVYELRQMGIPLQEYTPGKGSDKIARVNAISDLFASGVVWCPETRWADELMEELAAFPNGDHDDLVDSTSQALLRFRQGGFVSISSDEPDEPKFFKGRRADRYYTV
jgi:predicted phage terminase large subunit-like protein